MKGHGEAAGYGEPRLPRSEKSAGMDVGMRVLSYLIAGVAFYGFLGWLGDHFLGTGFLLPIGIVVGAALGCYVIIRRFGAIAEPPAGPDTSRKLTKTTGDREGAR
jgi:F0F1-type ATP synthase assembly protein I